MAFQRRPSTYPLCSNASCHQLPPFLKFPFLFIKGNLSCVRQSTSSLTLIYYLLLNSNIPHFTCTNATAVFLIYFQLKFLTLTVSVSYMFFRFNSVMFISIKFIACLGSDSSPICTFNTPWWHTNVQQHYHTYMLTIWHVM